MQQTASWLSRLLGVFLIAYGFFIAYQTWSWTRMGLHQRVYDGETQSEIDFNVITYAILHAPSMRYAGLFILSGIVIISLTFHRSQRPN